MNLEQAVAIDVLPRPGDTAVLSGGPRNASTHTFPVYLRGRPVTPTLASAVATSYSTVSNPCRPELSYSPAGCNAPNWTNWNTVAPSDLTAVTAVKFDFGANALAPGDRWSVDIPVTTPASGATEPDVAIVNPDPTAADQDEVAYNSTGFVINRTDLHVPLLPSEAQAVGLDMPSIYGPAGARPTAATRTTSGTGTAAQNTTLSIPAHGSVSLVDGLTRSARCTSTRSATTRSTRSPGRLPSRRSSASWATRPPSATAARTCRARVPSPPTSRPSTRRPRRTRPFGPARAPPPPSSTPVSRSRRAARCD